MFGSLARGDAAPGSDADLLMIVSHSPASFLDRSARYYPPFCEVGMDILVYTRAEIAQMQAEGNPFLLQALAEGQCLYERRQK